MKTYYYDISKRIIARSVKPGQLIKDDELCPFANFEFENL